MQFSEFLFNESSAGELHKLLNMVVDIKNLDSIKVLMDYLEENSEVFPDLLDCFVSRDTEDLRTVSTIANTDSDLIRNSRSMILQRIKAQARYYTNQAGKIYEKFLKSMKKDFTSLPVPDLKNFKFWGVEDIDASSMVVAFNSGEKPRVFVAGIVFYGNFAERFSVQAYCHQTSPIEGYMYSTDTKSSAKFVDKCEDQDFLKGLIAFYTYCRLCYTRFPNRNFFIPKAQRSPFYTVPKAQKEPIDNPLYPKDSPEK